MLIVDIQESFSQLMTHRGVTEILLFFNYSNLSNTITPQKGVIKSNGGVTEPLPGVTANLDYSIKCRTKFSANRTLSKDIAELHCHRITVGDDNEPASENAWAPPPAKSNVRE